MWTTALSDLREFLGDGPTTRSVWMQKLLGRADAVNKDFKAFNIRIVTAPAPRVFVNGTGVAFTVADALQGVFTLSAAPIIGDEVTWSGYHQYWTDDELNTFLRYAINTLTESDDPNTIPQGLRLCALHYAACQAFTNLSVRYTETISSQFHLSERKEKDLSDAERFMKIAADHQKQGALKRDEYYKRLGRREQPAFGVSIAAVPSYTPRR
jgi:hypothetical protein